MSIREIKLLVFKTTILYCKAIKGRGQSWLMRCILCRVDRLTCRPAVHCTTVCTTDTPWVIKHFSFLLLEILRCGNYTKSVISGNHFRFRLSKRLQHVFLNGSNLDTSPVSLDLYQISSRHTPAIKAATEETSESNTLASQG